MAAGAGIRQQSRLPAGGQHADLRRISIARQRPLQMLSPRAPRLTQFAFAGGVPPLQRSGRDLERRSCVSESIFSFRYVGT
jgi:hypothetical protein